MERISTGQRQKIFVLAGERGIDNDTLHAHVELLTGRTSIAALSWSEAGEVIKSLEAGVADSYGGRATSKQIKYIFGLAASLGWKDENGKVDERVLNRWIEKKFCISAAKWLTVRQASKAIEALKAMLNKDAEKAGNKVGKTTEQRIEGGKSNAKKVLQMQIF